MTSPAPTRAAAALAALLAFGGCTVGPDFEHPSSWWNPSSWGSQPKPAEQASVPVPEKVDPAWWAVFNDPELTSLETRVADANLDVRTAGLRLAQARATLGVTEAAQWFNANANGSYSRELQSKKGILSLLGGTGTTGDPGQQQNTSANGLGGTQTGIPNTALTQPFDLYQYGFDASWEVDLWGRVRRSIESGRAQVTASEEGRRQTLVTALAELARDYVQLRGVQRTLQITRDNLDTANKSLQLTQERFNGGLTTEVDVANAAAQVASTQSDIPSLEQREAQLSNAIALLVGAPPRALAAELDTPKPIPPVPPQVPVGLPSELARRRPDIRQAEANLHAATADVGVAVADFYPRFTLSGSAAIQALQPKYLTDIAAGTYAFGPSVTLPIFEGGRLTRTLELRKAQQQETAIAYQQAILAALHDVDNAMTAYAAEQRRRAALEVAAAQNRRALDLAEQRYAQGLIDFLTVLVAQRNLLGAEQQLADSTTTVSTNLVQLYKALGGGWETKLPDRRARAL